MAGSGLSERQKNTIVTMYSSGKRVAEIEEKCEVSRSTIYYVLDQAGIRPDRQQQRGRLLDVVPILPREDHENLAAWALARVEQLERENGTLRGRLSAIEACLRD